jgi:sulfur-carrier protein
VNRSVGRGSRHEFTAHLPLIDRVGFAGACLLLVDKEPRHGPLGLCCSFARHKCYGPGGLGRVVGRFKLIPPSRPSARVMAHLFFAASIQRHIAMPERDVAARSVDEALAAAFSQEPRLRGYILDDQGGLRRHLAVFVDGKPLRDRRHLSDAVETDSRIYVVQALSGG